jgi:hypothetical protein
MFPHGSVTLNILCVEKVEACTFLNPLVPGSRDLHTSYGKKKPSCFIFAFACLLPVSWIQVSLDTDRTFHGYVSPHAKIKNTVFTWHCSHCTSKPLKKPTDQIWHSLFWKVSAGIWTGDPWNSRQACYQLNLFELDFFKYSNIKNILPFWKLNNPVVILNKNLTKQTTQWTVLHIGLIQSCFTSTSSVINSQRKRVRGVGA